MPLYATIIETGGGGLVVEGETLSSRLRRQLLDRKIRHDERCETSILYLFDSVFYTDWLMDQLAVSTGTHVFGRQDVSPLTGVAPRIWAIRSTERDIIEQVDSHFPLEGDPAEQLWNVYRAIAQPPPGIVEPEIFVEVHDWTEWIENERSAANFGRRRQRRWLCEYVGPLSKAPKEHLEEQV